LPDAGLGRTLRYDKIVTIRRGETSADFTRWFSPGLSASDVRSADVLDTIGIIDLADHAGSNKLSSLQH